MIAPAVWALNPGNTAGWETLRELRNQCREFMTGSTAWITASQQEDFRKNLEDSTQKVYLVVEGVCSIAFLYLRLDCATGEWIPTYGVAEAKRGLGYGKFLVALSQVLCERLRLKVLQTNDRACQLYHALGFVVTTQQNGVKEMYWERP